MAVLGAAGPGLMALAAVTGMRGLGKIPLAAAYASGPYRGGLATGGLSQRGGLATTLNGCRRLAAALDVGDHVIPQLER